MKNEIVDKINKILISDNTIIEESKVVYLLVETRKLLEHDNSSNFELVKFYCDWAVHTEKDRITPLMKKIINQMYSSAEYQINNPLRLAARSITSGFAYLTDFRAELENLYKINGIVTKFISDDEKWNEFISIFIKVLENQPINSPTDEVKRIIFLPANDGCVIYRIEFNKPIKSYPYYEYMNAY